MVMGVDVKDFRVGCERIGGVYQEHSAWEFSCVLDRIGIGLNTNGLLQVFDYRKGTNEVHMKRFESFYIDNDNSLIFKSKTGLIRIQGDGKSFAIKTEVKPSYYGSALEDHKRELMKLGQFRFNVPEGSILRMPPPVYTKIDWELDKTNVPLFVADGNNMVKGTVKDFMIPSRHTSEFEVTLPDKKDTATGKPIAVETTISFVIGEELGRKRDYTGYMKPPDCILVGEACYARNKIYMVAEEIAGDIWFDKETGIPTKTLRDKRVDIPVFQTLGTEHPGLLRLTAPNGVNYLLYPDSWVPKVVA